MRLTADLDTYLGLRAVSDLSPRSVQHHRSCLRRVIALLHERGRMRWGQVTAADLDAVMLDLAEVGLSRNSLTSYAWSIRTFTRWLLDQGRVIINPADDLRVPDEDEVPLPPNPLTEGQVAALFASVPQVGVINLRIRLHLAVLYDAGLRNAEAVHLDLSDLDLDADTILVREGKGGKTRLLPLMEGTRVAATAYLALRRELLRGPDHGALFLSHTGRRLGGHWIQRWMKRAGPRLGFEAHPHLLRHSIAVHLLRRGEDIRNIQAFLGHAHLDTTATYLRLVPGQLREDYDRAMPPLMAEPR